MSPSSLALLSTLGWMLHTSLAVHAHGGEEEPEMAMPGMDHGSGDDDSMSMGMSMYVPLSHPSPPLGPESRPCLISPPSPLP